MDLEIQRWLQTRGAYFEVTPSGRVRCKLSGSEFVPRLEILEAFENGKKFKKLKELEESFAELKQFEPFFVRSKNFEDKVYCTLTGQLMGVGVAAVKMHTEGKKFKKAKEMFLEGTMELKPEPELTQIMEELERQSPKEPAESVSGGDVEEDAMEIDDSAQEVTPSNGMPLEETKSESRRSSRNKATKRKMR